MPMARAWFWCKNRYANVSTADRDVRDREIQVTLCYLLYVTLCMRTFIYYNRRLRLSFKKVKYRMRKERETDATENINSVIAK